jgi:putative aldouronate transport system substrate-binding protein
MKKIAFFAVCAALVMAVVGGCKGSSGGAPTLIWWTIGTSQPGFAEDMKVIADYVEKKIGVRVDIKQVGWSEAGQRFTTMVNAGEYFDILFVSGNDYSRFAALDAFADLTDLLPEAAPQLWEYIPDLLWEGVKVKGRILSVPTYKDSSRTGYYYWDHKYVEKYNIDLNRSGWAYLDEVFRRMKAGENNPRFYPFQRTRDTDVFLYENYDGLSASLQVIGVRTDDQQRRVVNTLEQPDIIEAFRYFHSWQKDGIINPDANMIDEAPIGVPFKISQAWPSVAISYALTEGIERYDPVRFAGPGYSTASIQGSMNAISVNSKYKSESLRFLQLVNSDTKLRDMLNVGIEGKHFEYVNNRTAIHRLRTDWPLVNYQQGSYFIETPFDDVPPGYWDEVRQQNEEAVPSVMLGFMMDIDPVMTEIMNCRLVYQKYDRDLVTGASNPDVALPRFIAELKSAGLDKVIAEAQRQVDAFAASKQ